MLRVVRLLRVAKLLRIAKSARVVAQLRLSPDGARRAPRRAPRVAPRAARRARLRATRARARHDSRVPRLLSRSLTLSPPSLLPLPLPHPHDASFAIAVMLAATVACVHLIACAFGLVGKPDFVGDATTWAVVYFGGLETDPPRDTSRRRVRARARARSLRAALSGGEA